MWIKEDPQQKRKIVEDELNEKAVPDALMYYLPIYQLHIALVCLSTAAEVVFCAKHPNVINVSSMIIVLVLAVVFAYYCLEWKPSTMRSLIERNVVIWKHALGVKDDSGTT